MMFLLCQYVSRLPNAQSSNNYCCVRDFLPRVETIGCERFANGRSHAGFCCPVRGKRLINGSGRGAKLPKVSLFQHEFLKIMKSKLSAPSNDRCRHLHNSLLLRSGIFRSGGVMHVESGSKCSYVRCGASLAFQSPESPEGR